MAAAIRKLLLSDWCWCRCLKTRVKRAIVIGTTILICGLIGFIIGIPLGVDAIARSRWPITLLHQDRVTSGETYQININNQSVSQDDCISDLCSASLCSAVTLTIDSFSSSSFTGKLDSSFDRDDLAEEDNLTVAWVNHTIESAKSYSDWVFHLHRGSTLNIALCAEAAEATGSTCHTTEQYIFAIIQGEQNFSLWKKTKEFKYTVYATIYPPLKSVATHDCPSQSTTLPLYTYTEDADYYHVIHSAATYDCDIRVFAYAMFERKQYYNGDPTDCTFGINKLFCSKVTTSINYVTIGFGNKGSVDWNDTLSFTLRCNPITNRAQLAGNVAPAFVVPLIVVLIGSVVIVCTCMYLRRQRDYYIIPEPIAHVQTDDNNQNQNFFTRLTNRAREAAAMGVYTK